MNILAVAGAVISLVSMCAAIWQANEARKARKGADESSQQALEAAERSARAMEKLAEVAQDKAERKVPPWSITHDSNNTYKLTNMLSQTMKDVDINVDTSYARFIKDGFPTDINGGAGRTFIFAPLSHSRENRNLNVTWYWPDGTSDEWTDEIPHKP